MKITVGKTEYGLPLIEWTQHELVRSSHERSKVEKRGAIYTAAPVFVFALLVGFLNAGRNNTAWTVSLIALFFAAIGAALGFYLAGLFYEFKNSQFIVGRHLERRPYRAKIMVGYSIPEKKPVLLCKPCASWLNDRPPDYYYYVPSNEVMSFSVESGETFLGSSNLRDVHVIVANLPDSVGTVVAMHFGSVQDVSHLRAVLQRELITNRPSNGWPDPSRQGGSQATRLPLDDDVI